MTKRRDAREKAKYEKTSAALLKALTAYTIRTLSELEPSHAHEVKILGSGSWGCFGDVDAAVLSCVWWEATGEFEYFLACGNEGSLLEEGESFEETEAFSFTPEGLRVNGFTEMYLPRNVALAFANAMIEHDAEKGTV